MMTDKVIERHRVIYTCDNDSCHVFESVVYDDFPGTDPDLKHDWSVIRGADQRQGPIEMLTFCSRECLVGHFTQIVNHQYPGGGAAL